ncbi:hypothetical protein ACTXT7_007030 [Hymenolepis weldensis]
MKQNDDNVILLFPPAPSLVIGVTNVAVYGSLLILLTTYIHRVIGYISYIARNFTDSNVRHSTVWTGQEQSLEALRSVA